MAPPCPFCMRFEHAFGCIPEAAIPMVAEALNLSRAEIYGTVTFFHDFRNEPPGRRVLKLCRANRPRPRAAMRSRRAPRRSSA